MPMLSRGQQWCAQAARPTRVTPATGDVQHKQSVSPSCLYCAWPNKPLDRHVAAMPLLQPHLCLLLCGVACPLCQQAARSVAAGARAAGGHAWRQAAPLAAAAVEAVKSRSHTSERPHQHLLLISLFTSAVVTSPPYVAEGWHAHISNTGAPAASC
jgi:hypothetical protein